MNKNKEILPRKNLPENARGGPGGLDPDVDAASQSNPKQHKVPDKGTGVRPGQGPSLGANLGPAIERPMSETREEMLKPRRITYDMAHDAVKARVGGKNMASSQAYELAFNLILNLAWFQVGSRVMVQAREELEKEEPR